MEPILVKPYEAEAWNEFVRGSNVSHIFQSFEWGTFKSYFGWRPIRIAFQENGKTKAALQVLVKRIPFTGKCFFYIPRGPVLDYEDEKVLAFVLDFVKRNSKEYDAFIVKVGPDILNQATVVKSTLEKNGFHQSRIQLQHRCTFRIDLTESLDHILARMESRTRYSIRKAERDGIEIIEDSDISEFFDLYAKTGGKNKFHHKGEGYFIRLQDFLVTKGLAKVFSARYKGKPVAGAVILTFGGKSWYMYGATSQRYRYLNSGHLLQWRIIRWAKENNLSSYDLQGIPEKVKESSPLWGIYLFKRGFGGKRYNLIGEHDLVWSKPFYWAWCLYSKSLR